MNHTPPILSFPLYEPAGQRVELTETELLQHVLIIGTTGCGKTTLLTSAIRQLLAHPDKPGLLILDAKVDGLVEQVRADAHLAGREDDVLVFGPDGDTGFDLFGGLRSLHDVERLTRRIMSAVEPFDRNNAYWQIASTGMVSAALTLLLQSGKAVTFENAVDWMREWFLSTDVSQEINELMNRLSKLKNLPPLVGAAADKVAMWRNLDPRTRSNLQSCLLNVLHPLLTPAATDCFSVEDRQARNPEAAAEGKICIVAVSAMREPELAKFFFRLAKQEFFEAVQRRTLPPHRLCGMVADEFPLVVAEDDIEQLATIRSKRCFILAATQGMVNLTRRLGITGAHAAVNNLNTVVFMRNREAETAVQAHLMLGWRRETIQPRKSEEEWTGTSLFKLPTPKFEISSPVCPVGALSRLEPHQAYVVHASGERTLEAVWFAPWFVNKDQEKPQPPKPATPAHFFDAAHTEQLMLNAGHRLLNPPTLVMAATNLSRERQRKRVLKLVQRFFLEKAAMVPEGLESLPTCWLVALPGILWGLRKPHWSRLPYFINLVTVQKGVLLLQFAQEQSNPDKRVTAWDKIRIAVNAGIYPNRWRPFSRQLEAELRLRHPELRPLRDSRGQELA